MSSMTMARPLSSEHTTLSKATFRAGGMEGHVRVTRTSTTVPGREIHISTSA